MNLAVVLISVYLLLSCTHELPNENAHLQSGEIGEFEKDEIRHKEGTQDDRNLWHPSYPTMSSTAMMLSWVDRPSDAELEMRFKEIKKLFDDALNKDSANVLVATLKDNVEDDIPLNHYTFYFAVLQVDIAISDGTISKNYKMFSENYRVLQIFAKALESSLATPNYVNFIKKRFIRISKDHFGRTLQPVNSKSLN